MEVVDRGSGLHGRRVRHGEIGGAGGRVRPAWISGHSCRRDEGRGKQWQEVKGWRVSVGECERRTSRSAALWRRRGSKAGDRDRPSRAPHRPRCIAAAPQRPMTCGGQRGVWPSPVLSTRVARRLPSVLRRCQCSLSSAVSPRDLRLTALQPPPHLSPTTRRLSNTAQSDTFVPRPGCPKFSSAFRADFAHRLFHPHICTLHPPPPTRRAECNSVYSELHPLANSLLCSEMSSAPPSPNTAAPASPSTSTTATMTPPVPASPTPLVQIIDARCEGFQHTDRTREWCLLSVDALNASLALPLTPLDHRLNSATGAESLLPKGEVAALLPLPPALLPRLHRLLLAYHAHPPSPQPISLPPPPSLSPSPPPSPPTCPCPTGRRPPSPRPPLCSATTLLWRPIRRSPSPLPLCTSLHSPPFPSTSPIGPRTPACTPWPSCWRWRVGSG